MEDQKVISKDRYNNKRKSFVGYLLPVDPLSISTIGIFAALTCVITMLIAFPIPATQGFINIGDAVVMITGLLFGPIIGSISGGFGSALADLFLGYTIYAPATLIIKGLEGLFVGLISNPRKNYAKFNYRDIIGILIGGITMVFGYFIYEFIIFGVPSALYEFVLNGIIQFGLGGLIAFIFIISARKNIVDNLPQVFDKIFIIES